MQLILKKDVQLLQLPCPEFIIVWISEMGTCEEPVSTSILHGTMP